MGLFSVSPFFAQPPRYTIHDLGPLSEGNVTGINIHGQAIGYETQSGDRVRSFRTGPNAAINWSTDDLGTLGGRTTRAYGINSSGQVAGESTLSSGEVRAFRTGPNRPIQPATDNLGTLGGTQSQASAINDLGQVTGSSEDASGAVHAFLAAPDSNIDPATGDIHLQVGTRILSSRGEAINNRGGVLGTISGYPVYPFGFLHTSRTEKTLPVTRYIWQSYAGITEQDQVVFSNGMAIEMWQDGKQTLLAACSSPCVPSRVNNSLQILGATQAFSFLYTGGVIYDLTTLFPQGSDWVFPGTSSGPSSFVINDRGQIAGTATFRDQTAHAFRLDPVSTAAAAIQQTLNEVRSLPLDRRVRGTLPLMLKAALAAKLTAALGSWNQRSPAATRGFLNEFENIVRAHAGTALSQTQADRLLEMAEAAIGMT